MRLAFMLLLGAAVVPLAVADSCVPSCEIPSHSLAFVPPLTVVESGSTVTWTTLDIVHTATDRATFCFHTDFNVGAPGSATFAVEEGALVATSDIGAKTCSVAPVADGIFLLEYDCLLHPNMRAQLLIR